MRTHMLVALIALASAFAVAVSAEEKSSAKSAAAVRPQPEETEVTAGLTGSTRIVVQNQAKVYLRIIFPNGSNFTPTYLRGTNIDFPIANYNAVDYCWSPAATPPRCVEGYIGKMYAGGTTTF